jgi:hypothetical protein
MALLLKKARALCWAAGKIRMEEVAACLGINYFKLEQM